MSPVASFVVTFVAACAITAAATAAIEDHPPAREARAATRFFTYMVVGIVAFSGLVYLLEQAFIRKG